MKRYARGISLIELLCTLLILGIVSAVAVPSFNSMIEGSQRTQATNQLLSALHFARSTAVYERRIVALCAGTATCAGTSSWSGALLIFHDRNASGQLDPEETLLRMEPLPKQYAWRWASFRQNGFVQFEGNGTTRAQNGTFTLCHKQVPQRQVVISLSGRARTQVPDKDAKC